MPRRASRSWRRRFRLAPGSVKALFNLAVAYGTSPAHGPRKEIEHLEKVIELAPDFPRAHLALGKALLQEGKAADAVTALQNAVKLAPDSGEANYQLGLALVRAGRKEEAAAQLKKGRDLVAADDRAQNALLDVADGRAALERKDFDEAVSKFRHASELRPESAEVKRLLAAALEAPRQRRSRTAAVGRDAGFRGRRSGTTPRACERARGLHPGRQVGRGRAAAAELRRRSGRSPRGAGTPSATPISRRRRSGIRSRRSPRRCSSI